jgi:hypothetical protein
LVKNHQDGNGCKFAFKSDFGGFQWPEVWEEKKQKSLDLYTYLLFILFCVAKNIDGWLKICALFLVYSQIWQNLLEGDYHFFLDIFLWIIATLATHTNFFIKKHVHVRLFWKE